MKDKIMGILQAILAIVLLVKLSVGNAACAGMLELANGGEAHMKCWFSVRAAVLIAILVLVMALASLMMDTKARKWMQLPIIVSAALIICDVSFWIGVCMKADMVCQATRTFASVIAGIICALGLVSLFSGKDNQIPD